MDTIKEATVTQPSYMWSFRCDPDLREAVKVKAKSEGRTATAVIRDALVTYTTGGTK